MGPSLYVGIWVLLMLLTLLEMLIFGMTLASALSLLLILGLAGIKALLIALFYQHLLNEPKGLASLYLAAVIAGSGLIMGMLASL